MHHVEASIPRIMGSETEYTTQFVLREGLRPLVPAQYILDDGEFDSHLWLRNGGRFYNDFGDLLEYATPECRSAKELAIHEQAGERLVSEVIAALPRDTLTTDEHATAYKRSGYDLVLSHAGDVLLQPMSAGHHENYSTFLDPHTSAFARDALSSYLATRPIWSGAGLVVTNGYAVSQKGSAINLESSEETTVIHHQKVGFLYNYDDRRLEIRAGEGNMSEWQIVQKFALTSLILRLIEHRRVPDQLILPRSYAAIFLNHLSYPMAEQAMSIAASHQRAFAEEGLKFADTHPDIPAEEITAAEAVIDTTRRVDDFIEDPEALPTLSGRLDWAAKRAYMLSQGLKPEEISTANLAAVMYDLMWENVARDGIARRWYKKTTRQKVDESLIRHALYYPPHTRALARTTAIQTLGDDIHDITWSQVSGFLESEDRQVIYNLADPASTTLSVS